MCYTIMAAFGGMQGKCTRASKDVQKPCAAPSEDEETKSARRQPWTAIMYRARGGHNAETTATRQVKGDGVHTLPRRFRNVANLAGLARKGASVPSINCGKAGARGFGNTGAQAACV